MPLSRTVLKKLKCPAVLSLGLLLGLATGTAASAQGVTGTIAGTVRASADAVLAGATVTVRNEAIGFERTVTTGEDGSYSVSGLPVQGAYNVRVEFSGLAPVVQSGVSLTANARVAVDITMHAATEETLVVTGRVPTLEPERSTVQQTVSETLVHALPLIGRNFISLASLAAGFTGNPNYPSSQGQLYWGNNVLVDGASHYSKWRGAARTLLLRLRARGDQGSPGAQPVLRRVWGGAGVCHHRGDQLGNQLAPRVQSVFSAERRTERHPGVYAEQAVIGVRALRAHDWRADGQGSDAFLRQL